MKTSKYVLEITVFVCGAVVMVYELVGSRILGPYFGTSVFVWTGLIGTIMGSLSLGYYLGGVLADRSPKIKTLSSIIFLSSIFVLITFLIKDSVLVFFQQIFFDVNTPTVVASLILFSPASVLLGMVSPYAAKIKLNSLNISGKTIGNLYALSTGGSIFGTFISGYFLIPHFGTNKLLLILSCALLFVSFMLSSYRTKRNNFIIIFILLISLFFLMYVRLPFNKKLLADVDTAYNRIWIYDRKDKTTGDAVRLMSINNENSSAMYLEKNTLVFEYTKYYDLAEHFFPNFRSTLMLGGAGYSYPKYFLNKYPEATMDVVEIDSDITKLAEKYFNLKKDSRLNIYHFDGRVFLNKLNSKYDVIFGDAFSSQHSIPYQLTTKEAAQRKHDVLNDGGVVLLNIISSIEGDGGKFLRAEYLTFKSVFSQVYLFPVRKPTSGKEVQNIILVALKSNTPQIFNSVDSELNTYLDHLWKMKIQEDVPILTDDFAPVDYYINKTI